MENGSKKVVLIGTGFVGMSYAYAALNQNACDMLVLIDKDKKKAEGEAMDLNHGLAFAQSHMKIWSGDYDECSNADIVAICAGVSQKPGESRISLLRRNSEILADIVGNVSSAGFKGVFLIASNPVDILARMVSELSGLPSERIIGTGTTLDTARLRYLLGDYFNVDPRNVHAYVIGEHGNSEFVPWSQAMIATKTVLSICDDNRSKYSYESIVKIEDDVRCAAQKIIEAKNATYYGIGMAMVRITKAILGDENSILTVSAMMTGEYGQNNVFVGSPCIVGRNGIKSKIRLPLNDYELKTFNESCMFLDDVFKEIGLANSTTKK